MTPAPYRVLSSEQLRDQLRVLLTRAVAAGVGPRVAVALRVIANRLAAVPTDWGAPLDRIRTGGFDVYQALHDGLHVLYAVREDVRSVWPVRVTPSHGHPLHDPAEPTG
jgi:hypothetical protein